MTNELIPSDYQTFLQTIKSHIQQAQLQAVQTVNRELILLYWQIGRGILERQQQQGWGAKVIDQLSHDLHAAFPQMKGFSTRNLKYMRAFALSYPDETFVQEVLAQITWYHHITLLDKVKDEQERLWYIQQAIAQGWSRNVLVMQQAEAKLQASETWQERGLVFCTAVGTPLNPPKVVDRFKSLLKKAGLPDIRFHDLSHSAATILLSMGVHPTSHKYFFN